MIFEFAYIHTSTKQIALRCSNIHWDAYSTVRIYDLERFHRIMYQRGDSVHLNIMQCTESNQLTDTTRLYLVESDHIDVRHWKWFPRDDVIHMVSRHFADGGHELVHSTALTLRALMLKYQ